MDLVHRGRVKQLLRDLRDELRLAGPDDRGCALLCVRIGRIPLLQLADEEHLLRVLVRARDLADRAVGLHDLDRAPVGHLGHRRPGDAAERLAVVERARQDVRRLDDEVPLLLGALAVVDVRGRADPEGDLAALVADRHSAPEVPAVGAVRVPEAVLDLEDLPARERLLAAGHDSRQVVGMGDHVPGVRARISLAHTRVVEPAAVEVRRAAVRGGRPHDLRHRIRELPVALLALAPERDQGLLAEQLGLQPQLLGLLPQLDEDRDLRAQHLRLERLEEVVDRAGRVAAEDVALFLRDRREEDDRDVARPLALLDQLGGLEPVELRHLDVEHHDIHRLRLLEGA